MVDYYSLQMFSLHAYDDSNKLLYGSKQIKPTEFNHHTGFKGKVYRAESGEIVISFRGTELDDIKGRGLRNDVNMACKILPAQLQNAFTMYKQVKQEYPNAKITLTGESLGGTLAALVAAETGVKAVTFSAYGAKDLIDSPKYTSNITNIGDTRDSIFMANVNQHIGNVYVIPDNGEVYMPRMANFLAFHGIKNMGFLLDMKEYKTGTVKSFMDFVKDGELYYGPFLNVTGAILKINDKFHEPNAQFIRNFPKANIMLLGQTLKNKINSICKHSSTTDTGSGHWVTIDGNHVFIEN